MSDSEQTAPREACPRCESGAVTRLRVMEHEACGAIKPESAFRDGDAVVCPDCEVACDDEVRHVARGTPLRCEDCGRNFSVPPESRATTDGGDRQVTNGDGEQPTVADDGGRVTTTDDEEQPTTNGDGEQPTTNGGGNQQTTAVVERVRNRASSTPSPRRRVPTARVLAVVAVLLVVSSAVVAVVQAPYPAGVRAGGEAGTWTETGAWSETGPETRTEVGMGTETGTETGTGSEIRSGAETGTGTETGSGTETGTGADAGTWTEYRTVVVFRNDDVQPHYRPETMRKVDQVFAEAGVPVTLGVVPAIGGEEVAPDGEFCRYLRTRARDHPETFEFALHGYTHERRTEFHGGSEFGGVAPEAQRERIREGTRALRACTGRTPTTFVPPFNTYDDATANALAESGYAVVSGGDWFTREYYDETGPFEAGGVLHLPSSQSFVSNWTTNEFYDRATLERRFDRAYRNGDAYVQMLHYSAFTDESKLRTLRHLVEYAKSKEGVAFMTVGEFARKYRKGLLERTDDGWRVAEPADDGSSGPTRRTPERATVIRNEAPVALRAGVFARG